MITFSEDDEAYLDRVYTPPPTPPLSDNEDERTKTLWYHDMSSHDQTVSLSLRRLHGKHCFYAGETIEVDVICTVRQLQLLSGVLEGFCVANGEVEETLVFQEVRLFPNQQVQVPPAVQREIPKGKHGDAGRKKLTTSSAREKRFKFWITIPHSAPPSIKISSKTGIFYRIRVCGIGGIASQYLNLHR
jgi:hypothetical protein